MPAEYSYHPAIHNLRAPRVVVPLLLELFQPQSVVDVGCGTGTWLQVLAQQGIKDFLGIDGSEYSATTHLIPKERYLRRDLTQPLELGRTFDLCLCLEVAEHLPGQSSGTLIKSLTSLAPVVVFSAAIPGQGGQFHINEQWLSHWISLFKKEGFVVADPIRPLIWDNPNVEAWYRQNTVIFTSQRENSVPTLDLVHPEVFKSRMANQEEMIESLKDGRQGVWISARIFVRALLFKLRSLI